MTGSGRLTDWSIRNRPAIHQLNGYSHFAIKAERDGKLVDARVLNGPYEGVPTGSPSRRKFDGFGFGAIATRWRGATFRRRDLRRPPPRGRIAFHRAEFPGKVRMTAFSPFIPHNERDSSMPAALFSFDVENDTDAAIEYTSPARSETMAATAECTSSPKPEPQHAASYSADVDRPLAQRGDLAITTDGDGVEHVDYHFRGQWFDS